MCSTFFDVDQQLDVSNGDPHKEEEGNLPREWLDPSLVLDELWIKEGGRLERKNNPCSLSLTANLLSKEKSM